MSLLLLLSPAKKQQFDSGYASTSQPRFKLQTAQLHAILKKKSIKQLEQLFAVSPAIATLNHQRFQTFNPTQYNKSNAKPCLFAFQGDAYRSLNSQQLTKDAIKFLQQHLRILSGFYGLLKPLDLIQPYRLEMGTSLSTKQGNTLYDFWSDTLTKSLNQEADSKNHQYVINLASKEYAKAIRSQLLNIPFITIDFKQEKNGTLKNIGIHAKRARGLMTRYIADACVTTPQQIKKFNIQGYRFASSLSTDSHFIFTRKETK